MQFFAIFNGILGKGNSRKMTPLGRVPKGVKMAQSGKIGLSPGARISLTLAQILKMSKKCLNWRLLKNSDFRPIVRAKWIFELFFGENDPKNGPFLAPPETRKTGNLPQIPLTKNPFLCTFHLKRLFSLREVTPKSDKKHEKRTNFAPDPLHG